MQEWWDYLRNQFLNYKSNNIYSQSEILKKVEYSNETWFNNAAYKRHIPPHQT